jgi:proteasome lid subunit RPN8/RPN11
LKPPPWKRPQHSKNPVLRFSPTAWAKLHYFCHAGETEIGGFGLASDPEDLLRIDEFHTVKQSTSCASVVFDDLSVADYFEQQVDMGHKPEQFARIWLHTHPGDSPHPSGTDEETFRRVFGPCDWAVMFILAKGGNTYCRLRFNTGPGAHIEIPVQVDYSRPFSGSDLEGWQDEFDLNIHPDVNHFGFGGTESLEGFEGSPLDMDSTDQLLDVVDERGQIELLMEEYGVDQEDELVAYLEGRGEHL